MTRSHITLPWSPPQQPAHRPMSEPQLGVPLDLQRLVEFAAREISHSEHRTHVGLTMTRSGRAPETVAATDDLPIRVDWLQYEWQQGPEVTSTASDVVVTKNLATDRRWPDFGRMCVALLGLTSMVSIAVVPAPSIRATLSFYSSEPSAFDHLDVDAALQATRLAAPVGQAAIKRLALSPTDEHPGTYGEWTYSKMAVALGIVMAQYRVGSTDAFSLLCQRAADGGRTPFDLAAMVAENGRLPENEADASDARGCNDGTAA